jgi:hypothetical protein
MRSWVWRILVTFSLLLCVCVLYYWPRSYFPKKTHFEASAGSLYIVFWDGYPQPRDIWDKITPDETRWGGVTRLWETIRSLYAVNEMKFAGFGSISGEYGGMQYHILAIPFWFLLLLVLVLLAASLYILCRHRRRKAAGHCLNCGYDLRESKDKCPECGSSIPVPSQVSS